MLPDVWRWATLHGQPIYEELMHQYQSHLSHEREKGEYSFSARRSMISRIGLPQVREYRLAMLHQEEVSWRERLSQASNVTPELLPLILVGIGDD